MIIIVQISCPIRDCENGVLTVEVDGRYRTVTWAAPAEWPVYIIESATCDHADVAWQHPDFEDFVTEALNLTNNRD